MGSRNEIQSEIKSLNDVFLNNSDIYFIPEFQRDFVWNESDLSTMLNDFIEDTKDFSFEKVDRLEGYLLGNIVLISDPEDEERKQVIDGQQRLTTLSLLFKALYETVMKQNTTQNGEEIHKITANLENGFEILNDDDEFEQLKIQHDPNLSFGKLYSKIARNEPRSEIDITTKADENVNAIYEYALEFFENYDLKKLKKFVNYFKKKVKLIVTTAPNMSKAFQLFEVLNDRGRSLEPMDLIKNHFLKTLKMEGKNDSEIQNFNLDWKDFTENLFINKKKQISSSTFIKHYLMASESINVRQEELFDHFKKDKSYNGTKILTFAKNISKVSKIYCQIEKENYDAFLKDNQNMVIIFKKLGVKQIQPLLIPFYDYPNDKKAKLVDVLTRFSAVVLYSYTQTNYIEKQIPNLMKAYNGNPDKESAFENFIQDVENLIDGLADQAQTSLENRDFTNKSGNGVQNKLKELLVFIEYYFNENIVALHPQKGKQLTVEHILSRNLLIDDYSKLGFEDENQKEKYINRLGNLTLMYNTDNASIGNSSFKDKVSNYRNCSYRMTHTIVEPLETTVKDGQDTKLFERINKNEKVYFTENMEHWTKELIEERSKDLANLFKNIVTKKY